jgi:histone deacetylase 1/2
VVWIEQTGIAVGMDLQDKLPDNEYYGYFGPDYTLNYSPSNMENKNSRAYLDSIRVKLLQNLSTLQHVPSVPFSERPPDTELPEDVSRTIWIVSLS